MKVTSILVKKNYTTFFEPYIIFINSQYSEQIDVAVCTNKKSLSLRKGFSGFNRILASILKYIIFKFQI